MIHGFFFLCKHFFYFGFFLSVFWTRALESDNIIPNVEKQADVMAAAVQAGKLLGERLTNGHDRAAVT
jgi:hypothetical protein